MTGHRTTGRLPEAETGLCLTGRHDPEMWFSDDPADTIAAIKVCKRCPIQSSCLQGAIDRRERHGVWGGKRFGRRDTAQADMRAWAAEVGIHVPSTGRMPAWLETAYEESRDLLDAAAHRPRKTA